MYEKTYKVSGKKVGDLGVEVTARGHKIKVDEPIEGGGEDTGMNPVEMLLGSIAACQTISTSIYAESMGIKIDEMSIEVEGDMDSAGFMGYAKFRPGYTNIRSHIKIKSDADPAMVQQLIDLVEIRCPVEDSVKNGVEIAHAKVEVEK
ncbi:OsmC family protein [Anaerotignum sp. MSJ-24]|uniref:OsmC family protein n=1 Tax=Anaerotignum sp. MSJ-24 TaxID=2841521 RepID=UPI001C126300|nr:OsmC family protein [Anaerotignum sp. MSJ-24]MBD9220431.1 OsmC family peroxiredoxin [Clostridiales bacterium]MBU5464450.1 OsmC family protein [Anaerotignum sp. MSJ-24]